MYALLYPGDTHPAILDVKHYLADRGYPVDRISHHYTPQLATAVRVFKRTVGLPENDVITTALWGYVDENAQDTSTHSDLRLSMADITMDWIIRDKTNVEGGHVNHKNDLGGETNRGITRAVADRNRNVLVSQFNWDGTMAGITKPMAYYIYKADYWDLLSLTQIHAIHPLIADKLFDIGINAGIGRAAQWLQRILNTMNNQAKLYPDIAVDGAIGPKTIQALNSYVAKRGHRALPRLLLALLSLQGAHYITISDVREANESFTYGWYDRMEHNMDLYYYLAWER